MGRKRITNPSTKASKPKKARRSARLATNTVVGAPSAPSTDMTDSGPNLPFNPVNAVPAVGAQPALQTQCVSEAVAAAWGPPTFQAPPSQPSTALHHSTAPAALGAPPSQGAPPSHHSTASHPSSAPAAPPSQGAPPSHHSTASHPSSAPAASAGAPPSLQNNASVGFDAATAASLIPRTMLAGAQQDGGGDPPPVPAETRVEGEQPIPSLVSVDARVPGLTPLVSVCAPLGDHLQKATRDKIGRGEFVDLGLLLENWGPSKPQEGLCLSLDELGRPVLKAQEKIPRRITSIAAWTSAFLIYASIYLSYHPHRTQGILKYMHTVRSAASRFGGYGWRQYDINFRMRQQRTPQRSWSLIDGELWYLFVISPPISRNASNPSPRPFQANRNPASVTQGQSRIISSRGSPGMSFPGPRKAACFGFNKSEGCKFVKCKFAHVCSTCKKPGHTALSCKQKF